MKLINQIIDIAYQKREKSNCNQSCPHFQDILYQNRKQSENPLKKEK